MNEYEPKDTGDYRQGGFVKGGGEGIAPIISNDFFFPTAVVHPEVVHLETIEARLTEQNALLAEIRDHLISLRVDLGPMVDYFASIMKAAQDQEAEATHLPIGFPAAAKLEEAGITAVAEVPRKSSTLRNLGLEEDEITAVLTELSQGNTTL